MCTQARRARGRAKHRRGRGNVGELCPVEQIHSGAEKVRSICRGVRVVDLTWRRQTRADFSATNRICSAIKAAGTAATALCAGGDGEHLVIRGREEQNTCSTCRASGAQRPLQGRGRGRERRDERESCTAAQEGREGGRGKYTHT